MIGKPSMVIKKVKVFARPKMIQIRVDMHIFMAHKVQKLGVFG